MGTATSACGVCDEQDCTRVYQYSVALTQTEADVRGMTRRFVEASAEMQHHADRAQASTGQPVSTPNIWHAAQARARAMKAAGEGEYRRSW